MNEEMKIIIKAVTDSAKKGIEGVKKELDGLSKSGKSASKGIGTAFKGVAKGAAIAVTAIVAVGAAIISLGKNTLQFNKEQAKLITAFQASGSTAQQASKSYSDLYRFLGDSGKAVEAARKAISSPLLETSIKGANGILINITVSPDVGLDEADAASSMITEEAAHDANIIWGVNFDETLTDTVKVTIIATGFEKKSRVVKTGADDESMDEVKPLPEMKEEDYTDIIDIINKNRGKGTPEDFEGKY